MSLLAIFDGMRGGKNRYFNVEKKSMKWFVINGAEELQNLKKIPIELQYSIAIHPSRFTALESLLKDGHGIAFGRQKEIPVHILDAVNHIANTHHGALYPWLEDLVTKQSVPRWSESDFEDASSQGIDLKQQASLINDHVAKSIQIKLIQSPNSNANSENLALIRAMEHDIQKIHSLEVAHQLCSEHLGRSCDKHLLFILSIVLFAPVAHALEFLLVGMGKFAAILLPSLYHESLRMKRSYSHGAASWQLADNIKARWPEILVMFLSGLLVQPILNFGYPALAGLCFALAGSSIFAGTELRRLKKARLIQQILSMDGKVSTSSKTAWLKLYYGPIWWVHGLSFVVSALTSIIIFTTLGHLLTNGWILSLTAILPIIYFELMLWLWQYTLGWRFKTKVKALLSNAIIT
ncbi:MAG: hypothetical protein P1P90_05375 [Patescibacteria group bacterium]|nr:hypothetical protein [Patescibacteria group bacterium]